MKSNKTYEYRSKIKWILVLGWILLLAVTFWYTNWIIRGLERENLKNLNFQLKTYETAINSASNNDAGFIFTEIIQEADFPIILTDTEGNITGWRNIPEVSDSAAISGEIEKKLQAYLEEIARENPPIEIRYQNLVLSRFYFGEQEIISRLRWLPILEALVVTAFILLGYLGFSVIRNQEQNLMWVGMAKETAHQLGTPLSSLMGWVALLKEDENTATKPIKEMEKDLDRLQRVANRFSKIGSRPKPDKVNLTILLNNTRSYFKKRLPQMGKSISIVIESEDNLIAMGNEDLLLWVFENLIKNAIDAIDSAEGQIHIKAETFEDQIKILFSDNGCGMNPAAQKIVFKPGYSTKKRGWGLGLTLVKRIVEDYHGGRIKVVHSAPGEGSKILVTFPKKESSSN